MQIEEKPNMPEQPFWPTFTAAPHRMMFFAGAIQLVLPILFWVFELIGRYSELWSPLNTLIPTTWAHAFVMLYGVFTFFIFGFLMTVYPRWMNGPLVKQEHYVNTFLWMALGILLFEVGIFFNLTLAATGLAIYLFGWAQGQWHLYQVYKVAAAQNKYYETALNFALTAGWTGAASFLAWIVSDQWLFLSFALKAGIWLFLLPVLFTVSH
ncbi:MAG: NnrS family protein, partial [Gammaproteobacteria bacterium]|nr:NnrS family protein [Gammaproteobacteria bacterium]